MTSALSDGVRRLLNAKWIAFYASLAWVLPTLLRLTLAGSPSPDEAELMIYAQTLRLRYDDENPPLVAWIAHLVYVCLNDPFAAAVTVRCTAQAAFIAGSLALIRRLAPVEDKEGAGGLLFAATAFLPFSSFLIGYDALTNYTHSWAALACGVWIAERALALQAGSWRTGLGLGMAVGLGFLAKYNLLLFLPALLAPAALDRSVRRAAFGPAGAVALLAVLAIAGPHALVLVSDPQIAARAASRVFVGAASVPGQPSLRFAYALLQASLPGVALMLLLLVPQQGPNAHRYARRFLLPVAVAGLGVSCLVAELGRATQIRPHQTLPLAALLLLFTGAALAASERRWVRRGLLAGSTIAAMALTLAAGIAPLHERTACRKCHTSIDWEPAAAAIRAAGFTRGLILSGDDDLMEPGQGLWPLFPDSRLTSLKHPGLQPSAPQPQPCLAVWSDLPGSGTRAGLVERGWLPAAAAGTRFTRLLGRHSDRADGQPRLAIRFALLGSQEPTCRAADADR